MVHKIVINKKGIKKTLSNLNGIKLRYTDSTHMVINAEYKNHGMMTGDIIYFKRTVCEHITFSDTRVITVIDRDNFIFDAFSDISVHSSVLEGEKQMYHINPKGEKSEMNYVKIVFDFYDETHQFEHNFVTDRHFVPRSGGIMEVIPDFYYDDVYNGNEFKRRCKGDYILCGDLLYEADGERYFNELNRTRYIFYKNGVETYNRFDNRVTVSVNGENYVLGGCNFSDTIERNGRLSKYVNGTLVIPTDKQGFEERSVLYWRYNDEDEKDLKIERILLSSSIDKGGNGVDVSFRDERFYRSVYKWVNLEDENDVNNDEPCKWYQEGMVREGYIVKETEEIELIEDDLFSEKNTIVSAYINGYVITLPLGKDYDADLLKQENLKSDYLNSEKEKSINEIIDYERKVFVPYFIDTDFNGDIDNVDDDNYKCVDKIRFNLHFRTRNNVESEDFEGYYDYGEFIPDMSNDWNICGFDMTTSTTSRQKIYYNDDVTDLLGNIGFTDEDVYYQKNKLKNTFIRLVFYDSMNVSTQKMLGYNTMFIDTAKLYNKYVNNINNKYRQSDTTGDTSKKQMVYEEFDYNNDLRLGVEFECGSKYNTDVSSDGFYLYTYPTIVNGSVPTPIYMKVEFNHAKYGKTINFMMPVDKNFNPIGVKNRDFPFDYMNGDNIDVSKALKDFYIKLYVKYNAKTNEYMWFLPRKLNDGNITFNLYEQKIINLPSHGDMCTGTDYPNSGNNV